MIDLCSLAAALPVTDRRQLLRATDHDPVLIGIVVLLVIVLVASIVTRFKGWDSKPKR